MTLCLYLTPDNIAPLSEDVNTVIKAHGKHNTLVLRDGYCKHGKIQNIEGNAEMYVRAFGFAENAADKLKLAYTAVFDATNLSKSSLKCNVAQAVWQEPDKTIEKPINYSARLNSLWNFRLHDIGDYSSWGSKGNIWKDCYMQAMLLCLNFKNAQGNMDIINTETQPGQIHAMMLLNLHGYNEGTLTTQNFFKEYPYSNTKKVLLFTEGKDNGNSEVTMQYSLPIEKDNFPYAMKNKALLFDFRAHAKCSLVKTGSEPAVPAMIIETARFHACSVTNKPLKYRRQDERIEPY